MRRTAAQPQTLRYTLASVRSVALLADLWRRGTGRAGLLLLALLLAIAASANLIASDLPLLARVDGTLYVLPNIFGAKALRGATNQSLTERLGPADWIVVTPIPWGPNVQDKGHPPLAAPDGRHLLGTDAARRDVLARLLHGTRVSLWVGIASVAIYISIGTLLGLLAGYLGGWIDGIISRLIDAVLSIPMFFLILALMGLIDSAGVGTVIIVIGVVSWTRVARLVRGETLQLRSLQFVEAGVALGYSRARIMFRHILPNAIGPVIITAAFGMASAVLVEAALSFLGFGALDTTPSWGSLLRDAMGNFHAWWLAVFPGAALFVTVTAYNLLGEALRESLDPRSR